MKSTETDGRKPETKANLDAVYQRLRSDAIESQEEEALNGLLRGIMARDIKWIEGLEKEPDDDMSKALSAASRCVQACWRTNPELHGEVIQFHLDGLALMLKGNPDLAPLYRACVSMHDSSLFLFRLGMCVKGWEA